MKRCYFPPFSKLHKLLLQKQQKKCIGRLTKCLIHSHFLPILKLSVAKQLRRRTRNRLAIYLTKGAKAPAQNDEMLANALEHQTTPIRTFRRSEYCGEKAVYWCTRLGSNRSGIPRLCATFRRTQARPWIAENEIWSFGKHRKTYWICVLSSIRATSKDNCWNVFG